MKVQCTGDDPYRCRGCSHLFPHEKNEDCNKPGFCYPREKCVEVEKGE